MKFILSLLITTTAILANAQTSGKQAQFNSVWGIDYNSNMVKQPSAQKNVNDVALNGGATATRDTDVGDRIDNIASYRFVLPAMASVEILLNPPNDDQTSGNCGGSGEYKTTGSGLVAEITDGSSNRLNFVKLPSSSGWRSFKIPQVTCAASGARRMFIGNPTGSSITVNVGKLYYGRMEPGAGVPPNTFTAKVSATGVVSDETGGDWISGNCTIASTSVNTCNFISGIFSSSPNCTISAVSSGAVTSQIHTQATTGSVVFYSYNTTNAGNTAIPFNVTCTKTGSDYIQPAVTAQNWNFNWKNYTATITSDTGTLPAHTVVLMQYRRTGGQMWLRGRLTFNATGTWAGIRIPPPPGITMDTSVPPNSIIRFNDVGVNSYRGDVTGLSASHALVLSFGGANGGAILVNQATPFSWVSGDSVDWEIGPIDAIENGVPWTETWNALQLVGSVTSNASRALRVESAKISNNGSACSVLLTSSNWIGSPVRNGAGRCTLPYVAGTFSVEPQCTCVAQSNTGAVSSCGADGSLTLGTTNFAFTSSQAGTATDLSVNVTCIGPR